MYSNIYQYHCLSSETHLKGLTIFSEVVSEKKNHVFSPDLNMLVIKRETGGYMGTSNIKNP